MIDERKIIESCSLLNKTRILIYSLDTIIQRMVFDVRIPVESISDVITTIKVIENCIAEHMGNLGIPDNAILKREELMKFLEERYKYESTLDFKNMTPEDYKKYTETIIKNYESFLEGYNNAYMSSTEKSKEEIDILKRMYGEFSL